MHQTIIKREQFRMNLVQKWREVEFEKKRKYHPQPIIEETLQRSIQEELARHFRELIKSFEEFKNAVENFKQMTFFNKQIEQLLKQINPIMENLIFLDLNDFSNYLDIICCYMRENYLNYRFPDMIEFLGKCCSKNMVFCNEYCKSILYSEFIFNLDSVEMVYRIKILKHVNFIQSLQSHEIDLKKIVSLILYINEEIKSKNQINQDYKCAIKEIIYLFLQIQGSKNKKLELMQAIANYFLVLILKIEQNQEEFLIDDELVLYLDFLSKNQQFFQQQQIELINQLAFNPKVKCYANESAQAIGIIGILMAGSSVQTNFYFDRFGDQINQLDKRLLQQMRNGQSVVRRMTAFCLSNIFGEDNLESINYYNNGSVKDFMELSYSETQNDVLTEIYQSLRNLIINADQSRLELLLNLNLIDIIIKNDSLEYNKYQIECLSYLVNRVQERTDCDSQLTLKWLITEFYVKGVHIFVQALYQSMPKQDINLVNLMKIILEN